jgi:hypothetical protein
MAKEVPSYLVEAGQTIARGLMREWLDSRAAKRQSDPTPKVTVLEGAEADAGCPYCSLSSNITIAYRYLVRIRQRPALQEIYTELAGRHITSAIRMIHRMDGTPANGRIMEKLHSVEVTLMRPLRQDELERITADMWALTDLCLEMAEAVNDG